jgi:hypothetical protein
VSSWTSKVVDWINYSLSTLMYSDSQPPISKPAEMVDDVEKKYGAKDWEEFDRLE